MRSCGGESGHNGGGVRLVMRSRKEEGRDKVGRRPPLRWRANVRQGGWGVVIGCGKWLAEEVW